MDTIKQQARFKRFFIFTTLFTVGIFVFSGLVMFLWNRIIPAISSFSALTYWQAMGLLVLCRVLFGGFRFGQHHKAAHRHFENRAVFKDKFMAMSEDERAQFKNQWKQRCCKNE